MKLPTPLFQRFSSGAVFLSLLLLATLLPPASSLAEEAAGRAIGRKIENFTLKDWRGKSWSLKEIGENKTLVVAFLGVECPLVKLYATRLAKLTEKYQSQDVAFVGVNSNQQDSLTEIAHFVRVHNIEFPVLKDPGNLIADQFGAKRTPEIFVLDGKQTLRYHGRIDDQYTYGVGRPKSQRDYLANALDALLAGEKVETAQTEVVGCHIGRVLKPKADSEVTYSQQISRILQKHCVECHRPGEIAPFSLTSYEEVVGWAEMIAEVVQERRMPPWHADPSHRDFINDARLSDQEKQLIYRWVESGAPEGDPAKLPPPREFTPGWRIGKPDMIIYMRDKPFSVKAEGEVRYQYFTVDPGFKEDKWIQAAQCRPGNRSVVHHILVGVLSANGRRQRVHGLRSQWLAATAPGARPLILREGFAKKVPAGSRLMFQLHYTPNGTPQKDRSCIGLIFADPKTVKKQVFTQQAANSRFAIPPGAENHLVKSRYRFRHDSLMLALFPHMHLRGKSFNYVIEYPDGNRETLLNVPQYDFNWQNGYEFKQPKRIPKGSVLRCEAHFDNSENNLANPDSTVTVRWGDQTWEEMMIGYFDMALADQDLTKEPPLKNSPRTKEFLDKLQRGESEAKAAMIDEELKHLAAEALMSNEALKKFAARLQERVPQLDRVCWTTVQDGKLTVRLAAQSRSLRSVVGAEGLSIDAEGKALADYAENNRLVVHPRLSIGRAVDLRHMNRAFASSMHVPISIDGEHGKGTLNFWSKEEKAFPPPAVQLLEKAAKAVKKIEK